MTTLNPFLAPSVALTAREWYVSIGEDDPVGPVSADQIARGIRAGKVPADAQIVRVGGVDWHDVLECSAIVDALKAL